MSDCTVRGIAITMGGSATPAGIPSAAMATHRLDAKGLQCPLPVLRARKVLKSLAPGDVLEIEATDPGAMNDFEAFCEAAGYRLLSASDDAGIYRFSIEKASVP